MKPETETHEVTEQVLVKMEWEKRNRPSIQMRQWNEEVVQILEAFVADIRDILTENGLYQLHIVRTAPHWDSWSVRPFSSELA